MTKFTKSILRIILPLASLGIFLIASIVVLIISQGRRLEDDGNLIQTGIIRITSIPSESIKAYVNNEEVTLSDFRITGIVPGFVTLRLSKEGYTSWEKQVKVESGVVKDVFAQLYPNTVDFAKVTEQNIDKVFYSPDSQYIYYTILDNQALNGIWRIRLNRNLLDFSNRVQPTQLIKFSNEEIAELSDGDYSVEIAPNNNKLLLKINSNYILYNLAENNKRTLLNTVLGGDIDNLRWFREDQSIIYSKGSYYFEYDFANQQISLIKFDGDNNIGISANNIYFVKDNQIYIYTNKATSLYKFNNKLQGLLPVKIDQIYTIQDNPNIFVISTDQILLYVDVQKEFIDVIDTTAQFYKALNNGRLILYSKGDELYSYFTEDNFASSSLDTFNYNLNTRLSDFDNLIFTPTGKNLLFFKDKSVSVMDYDGLNSSKILKEFSFIDNKVLISANNTEIYALIEEKDSSGINVRNLYKFDLKLKDTN